MNDEIKNKLWNTEIEILDYIVEICQKNNLDYFLIGGTLLGAVRHKGFIPWDDDLDIAMPRKDYEKFIEVFENNNKFVLDTYSTNENYFLPFSKVRRLNSSYLEENVVNYKGNTGIWVDIFPLDNGNKEKSLKQKFQFKLTKLLRSGLSEKNNAANINSKKYIKVFRKVFYLIPASILKTIQLWVMKLNKNNDSKYFINLGSQYGPKKQTHLKEKYYPIVKYKFEDREYDGPCDYDYVLSKIYGKDYMQLPPIEKRITHNPKYIKFTDGEEVIFDEKI